MRIFILLFLCIEFFSTSANTIIADSSNYTQYLSTLVAGDTLKLLPGSYVNNLTLNGINGTSSLPVVIMGSGNATSFKGQSCCNTVSITQCSYLKISDLELDGMLQFVDAVKAEGTAGNWAHHITIERLNIRDYSYDQQSVGISTKCSAWDWIIRKNRIVGVGTGMYLGNSNGAAPFVNGIIEYNYIAEAIGYDIEIKQQLDTVRDDFAGTSVDGKTIIRHNVFTKDAFTSSTGSNARPNLLTGGFPLSGFGTNDYYEIYGNLFFNNPVEALYQGTGNIILYNNIFINHFDPSGSRAVYITPQNGVSPQNVKIFHNTVWAQNSSGGIRLYNPNTNYQQYCYSNLVLSPLPITNFSDTLDNIVDTYANASIYFLSADTNIQNANLYPTANIATGTLTPDTLFTNYTDYNYDFNGDSYDWTYRGAYSGCCSNTGWQLQPDTMPDVNLIPTYISQQEIKAVINIYPNPASGKVYVCSVRPAREIIVIDRLGNIIKKVSGEIVDLSECPAGVYYLRIDGNVKMFVITK